MNQGLKYCIILAVIYFSVVNEVCGQSGDKKNIQNEDSLRTDFMTQPLNISTVNKIHSLAEEMMVNSPISAMNYIDTALIISKKLDNDSCITLTNYYYGRLNDKQANYYEAALYYFKALERKEFFNDTVIGNIYNFLGECYNRISNNDLYLKYLGQANKIYDSLNYPQGLGKISHSIGNDFYQREIYDEALKYYLQTLEYYKKSNYKRGMALTYNNIGNVYETLEMQKLALVYYNKGIDFAKQINDGYVIALIEMNIGNLLINQGDRNGISYLEKVKEYSLKNGFKTLLLFTCDVLGTNYAMDKKFDIALENINLYLEYYTAIFDEEKRILLAQLDYKHELEKKRKQEKILMLKQEKKRKIQNIVVISSVIIIILMSFLYYFNIKNKMKLQRSNQELLMAQLEREELKRKKNEDELKLKNDELEKLALHIIQKNNLIKNIQEKINVVREGLKRYENLSELLEINQYINQSMGLTKDRNTFNLYLEKYNQDFIYKITNRYPDLTEMEKRLIVLLRLSFSTKEIATLFNITSKSVEIYRSNLRKKINLDSNQNFSKFLAAI